jgi:hypothetical protein
MTVAPPAPPRQIVDAGDIEDEELQRAKELSMQTQPQPQRARGYGADDARGLGGGGGGGGQTGSYAQHPAPAPNDDMFLNMAMEQSLKEALPGEDDEALQKAIRESLEGQPVKGGADGTDEALQRAPEESEREAAAKGHADSDADADETMKKVMDESRMAELRRQREQQERERQQQGQAGSTYAGRAGARGRAWQACAVEKFLELPRGEAEGVLRGREDWRLQYLRTEYKVRWERGIRSEGMGCR